MKRIFLLITVLIISSCSKEEGYGPFNLKDGQEVELSVSHRYGTIGDAPLLLPQNVSPQLQLSNFVAREPGYNYRVKARMVAYKGPVVRTTDQQVPFSLSKPSAKRNIWVLNPLI